jgi:hypothetical protein
MTKLERKVRREVERGEGRKPLVVILEPATGAGGAMVAVMEKGRPSTRREVSVGSLYVMLVEREVAARRAARTRNPRRVSLLTGRAR